MLDNYTTNLDIQIRFRNVTTFDNIFYNIFVGYCNLLYSIYECRKGILTSIFLHDFCCGVLNVNYIDISTTRAYFVSGIVFARQRNVISYLISCKSAHSLIVLVNVINVVCSHLRHSTHDYMRRNTVRRQKSSAVTSSEHN